MFRSHSNSSQFSLSYYVTMAMVIFLISSRAMKIWFFSKRKNPGISLVFHYIINFVVRFGLENVFTRKNL